MGYWNADDADDAIADLRESTASLRRSTAELRTTIRETALTVATAAMDSLARDSMARLATPVFPADLTRLTALDDIRIGDQMREWYSVRDSDVVVRLLCSVWGSEVRLFASNGEALHEPTRDLMKRLFLQPMEPSTTQIICDFVRQHGAANPPTTRPPPASPSG